VSDKHIILTDGCFRGNHIRRLALERDPPLASSYHFLPIAKGIGLAADMLDPPFNGLDPAVVIGGPSDLFVAAYFLF
jgi:hypothetical protein